MLDIKQPQPALLAHGQRDEAAQFDQLGFGEVLVQPRPQLVGGFQPPGNGFRISQSGLLTPTEPLGLLEIEQVVVLALAQALRPGLLRPLIAAVLAFHAPRHVDAAEFLDGMVADPVAEDGLPGAGESPEARRDVSAHGRTFRSGRSLALAPLHFRAHLLVHRLR